MRISQRLFYLVLAQLMLLTSTACSTYQKKPTDAEQLVDASRTAGVEVLQDEIFSLSRGNETFITAPIAAWARIPATELRKGINIAFAYVSMQEPNVPAGYYTIRAFADDIRVGTVQARVQLVGRDGKVATEIPTQAEIHSLTVPANARTIFVTTPTAANLPAGRTWIWYRCSNGQCVLIPIFRPRTFD